MRRTSSLLVVLAACGGQQKPAPPSEMKQLAAQLDADVAAVVRIVHDNRSDCPALAAALKKQFALMQPAIDRAHRVQSDPARAKELTTEMHAYDAKAAEYGKSIERDFTVDAPCARDAAVREVMVTMPTL
ncbi:MAG TPA: hypothetical protein VGM90_24155 [Kofleriaceae bacterium]|jgi:hypothetical protein